VPLKGLAAYSKAERLERTTLYLISPALNASGAARSKLYSAEHDHLFRPAIGATPAPIVQP